MPYNENPAGYAAEAAEGITTLLTTLRKPTSVYRLLSAAATTNGALIKASSADVHLITGFVNRADEAFLKLYNKATAPTVGTDTPVVTLRLLRSVYFTYDLQGLNFPLGLGIAITASVSDADTGALNAGDIQCLNLLYA